MQHGPAIKTCEALCIATTVGQAAGRMQQAVEDTVE